MQKHLPYVFWILTALAISYTAGSLLDPGPIRDVPVSAGYHRGARSQSSANSVASPSQPNAYPGTQSNQSAQTQHLGTGNKTAGTQTLIFSQLYALLDEHPSQVQSITFENGSAKVRVQIENQPDAIVVVPDDGKRSLIEKAAQAHIAIASKEAAQPDGWLSFLKSYGFLIVLVVIGILIVSNLRKASQAQPNQVNGMGKSRGKTFGVGKKANGKGKAKQTLQKVTWDDVAGCDEAVTELKRLVEGLVGRDVYKKFGAELPKGVLLVGPPGTGKTLLARVVANMTDGGFEAASGSDFVEMLVGVGASRVRDTFDNARKYVAEHKKPFVIFIDEIDAIGGKRSTGMNTNTEREQTLNALLVELDGVVGNDGVVVIAATNRVDMLDEGPLVRPGRFDCQVNVDLPDVVGREKIFAIHMRGKAPVAADVTAKQLAKISFSYSGAEIKTACNRAAFLAAEQYDRSVRQLIAQGIPQDQAEKQVPCEITMRLFDEGLISRFGDAKVSKQSNMTRKTMLNTAWHEGGHAFASAFFKTHSDPVVKITIMRRSKALGYVQTMPEVDMVGMTRKQCIARIVMAMAGRASQEIYLRTCDSGASGDFQQATAMARRMVMEWGMSDKIGRVAIPSGNNQLGGGLPGIGNDLANAVDREVRRITDACYAAAIAIVKAEKAGMTKLVEVLMEHETVLGDQFKALREQLPCNLDINDLKLPFWTEGEDDYELSIPTQ